MAGAAGVVPDAEGAEAPPRAMLAEALEANRQLSELAEGALEENARLRAALAEALARDAERDAELERLRADLTMLQRLLFGRSWEKLRPGPPGSDGGAAGERGSGASKGAKRGPGGAGGAAGLLASAPG